MAAEPLRSESSAEAAEAPSPTGISALPDGELSAAQFGRISRLLYQTCGINLQQGKEQLVRARLWKRMKARGITNFKEYLTLVEGPQGDTELSSMVDALTTNKTSFFREPQHFEFLRRRLREEERDLRRLRIWSAGCSTGQEPYTLAVVVLDEWPDLAGRDVRILATDISSLVLAEARQGLYSDDDLTDVPPAVLKRFFASAGTGTHRHRIGDRARSLVRFARLNLMGVWPMAGPFDYIFCRNVMIYFDKGTQHQLVQRFWEILRPGGHLMVGHSESLTGRVQGFRYVQPAVYQKVGSTAMTYEGKS